MLSLCASLFFMSFYSKLRQNYHVFFLLVNSERGLYYFLCRIGREDLFCRINFVEIHLPPLRERLEDIPLLLNLFINSFNTKFGKQINGVTNDVLHMLMSYSWPGNVREFEHSIEHAFVL